MDNDCKSNEEYREEINKIVDSVEDNSELRFIYRYINGIIKE